MELKLIIDFDKKIGNEGSLKFGEAFKNLNKLTDLTFEISPSSEIRGYGIQFICDGLKQLKNLLQLSLTIHMNEIGREGV